ncbi:MAG TPA: hypothetical protein VK524_21400 [Polyangiaceae bacterium]|nr:hypothetical protein [Polyangiaceae bacterium]
MVAPFVRARHMKTFVETIDALDERVRARIYARLAADDIETIAQAVPVVWLPMNLNVLVTDATSLELGPQGAHDFFRALVTAEYRTDTFRSFLASIGRLLGLTPSTYVKMTPKGWELVFKNCGSFRPMERERERARLEYKDIPQMCVQNQLWMESVRSSFYSAFELTGVSGDIRWEELDLNRRRAIFLFTWQEG